MKNLIAALAVCIFALLQVSPAIAMGSKRLKVVMISIDGLRPEFYTNAEFVAPTLKRLARNGAVATGMLASFPSVTYPNHTSLITGVQPKDHGILSNTLFHWDTGPSKAWYWEAHHIKADPIWRRLAQEGKTTAAIRWPVTVGANDVRWLIPEIFPKSPWYEGSSWDLTVQLSDPALILELMNQAGLVPFVTGKEADAWAAKAAAYLLEEHQPDLTIVHLIEADHVQHSRGRDSAEVKTVVQWIDQQVELIVAKADEDTCVLIVGDHGFYDYTAVVHINRLFVDAGWITTNAEGKMVTWEVIAQKSGGQAAIYTKNRQLIAQVLALLKANQSKGFKFISKAKLNQLGAYPDAIAAIEGAKGFSIGSGYTKPLVEQINATRGQHGYLPSHPELHTGFIASGCGIQPKNLGLIRNVDVTPTILRILNTPSNGTTGRELDLF